MSVEKLVKPPVYQKESLTASSVLKYELLGMYVLNLGNILRHKE